MSAADQAGRQVMTLTNSYTDWIDANEDRLRRGIPQRYCGLCAKWWWDDEPCGHDYPRLTQAEFDAMTKRIAAEVRRRYPTQEDRYRREIREARRRGEL